jgi:hypothetical protein
MKRQRKNFQLGSALLLGAVLFFSTPSFAQESSRTQLPQKNERQMKPADAQELDLELLIQSDPSANKTVVFKVPQNAWVSLQVKSEKAGELHLHAYRLSLTLKDHDSQILKFKAKASGKFNIEWHPKLSTSKDAKQALQEHPHAHSHAHSHAAPLASLEVQPL